MMTKFFDTCSLLLFGERLFETQEPFVISSITLNELEDIKTSANKDAAFALGLFDGDGSLYCSSNYSTDVSINYTAYYEKEVIDFQNLINSLVGIEKKNKNFYTSAWHTQWRGRLQVINILDVLYKGCPRFLKRKHDKYIALKNSLN